MNTCKTCKWWKQVSPKECDPDVFEEGHCHRHAPLMFHEYDMRRDGVDNQRYKGLGVWPGVSSREYCGDHEPIAEVKP